MLQLGRYEEEDAKAQLIDIFDSFSKTFSNNFSKCSNWRFFQKFQRYSNSNSPEILLEIFRRFIWQFWQAPGISPEIPFRMLAETLPEILEAILLWTTYSKDFPRNFSRFFHWFRESSWILSRVSTEKFSWSFFKDFIRNSYKNAFRGTFWNSCSIFSHPEFYEFQIL